LAVNQIDAELSKEENYAALVQAQERAKAKGGNVVQIVENQLPVVYNILSPIVIHFGFQENYQGLVQLCKCIIEHQDNPVIRKKLRKWNLRLPLGVEEAKDYDSVELVALYIFSKLPGPVQAFVNSSKQIVERHPKKRLQFFREE